MSSEPELLQRLKVLERKASREKKARQLAEQQLEKYSLEIYQTNQSLQKSLVYAEKKQSDRLGLCRSLYCSSSTENVQ